MQCFLATSNPANIAFYERFGFRVTEQVELPANGPRETLMVREPRQV
jgi:ribosomal protein S18 acetylase RimI-like enzyme